LSLLLALAASAALIFCLARRGGNDGWGRVAIAVLLVVPALHAAFVLWSSRERLEALHLTYVGKRLAWGEDRVLSGGGSSPDSETGEDLHAVLLAADALRLTAAGETDVAGAQSGKMEGLRRGDPILRLSAPAPVVRVDGKVINAVPLAVGDRLLITAGGGELTISFDGSALRLGDRTFPLPGFWSRAFSPGQILFFPDLLAKLAPELSAAERGRFYSLLVNEDGWRVVLRDRSVRVLAGGEESGLESCFWPLPRSFQLQLQVAWGSADARRLITVRDDRLRVRGEESLEIRFGEPQRRVIPLVEVHEPLELGLVVPSSLDRRPHLIELDERSPRFHGLTATLRYEPETRIASLRYLGSSKPAGPEGLFALGNEEDQMLIRLDHTRLPWGLVFQLVLCALFLFVFLGPALARSPALLAMVAAVGLLLTQRQLFSYRAAAWPPDFLVRGYGEARLGLWLVPALLLFGWTAGRLLRRLTPTPENGDEAQEGWWEILRHAHRNLRWPLWGLIIAAVGLWLSARGLSGLAAFTATGILALAAVLVLLYLLAAGPAGRRLARWQAHSRGWEWKLWWLPVAGGGILLVRGTGAVLGMPEALRVPGTPFRVLWTVLHLPLAALLVGLACQRTAEIRDSFDGLSRAVTWKRVLRSWGWGIVALLIFLGLAFVSVAVTVGDTGLLIVHALPLVVALLLLLTWPRALSSTDGRTRFAFAGVGLLALLPLLVILTANLMPERMMVAYDRLSGAGSSVTVDEEALDASRLRATTAQQLFRLYMLANPEELRHVGIKPSERVAIQWETLKNYTLEAGWTGSGFHSSRLPSHLGATYLNDLLPMSFVLADFGQVGMLSLALTYGLFILALLLTPRKEGERWGRQGAWMAALALLALGLPGLYMILANMNLVLFTGKNCALLALNSLSDLLESGLLGGLAAFGLALKAGSP